MGTTIPENENMMDRLFGGIHSAKFMPSVPNLPYQYRLFLNYEASTEILGKWNEEIPREFENLVIKERVEDTGADAIRCVGGALSFEELLDIELAKEH